MPEPVQHANRMDIPKQWEVAQCSHLLIPKQQLFVQQIHMWACVTAG